VLRANSAAEPVLPYPTKRQVGISAVIHQPYFLPWLGCFSKLCFCDVFVVLDNVHFTKQHFLDRTRIIDMHGQIAWLSLPTGQNLGRPIAEVGLRPPDPSFISRLLRTIKASYAKAFRFDLEWPFLENLLFSSFSKSPLTLLEIDLDLIGGIFARLGISPPRIVMASAISSARRPTERLAEITEALGITRLIIGAGRSQAVHDLRILRDTGVEILVQDYLTLHPQYSQSRRRRSEFIPGLSVLDSLFNVGAEAVRAFVSAERYRPVPLGAP